MITYSHQEHQLPSNIEEIFKLEYYKLAKNIISLKA